MGNPLNRIRIVKAVVKGEEWGWCQLCGYAGERDQVLDHLNQIHGIKKRALRAKYA